MCCFLSSTDEAGQEKEGLGGEKKTRWSGECGKREREELDSEREELGREGGCGSPGEGKHVEGSAGQEREELGKSDNGRACEAAQRSAWPTMAVQQANSANGAVERTMIAAPNTYYHPTWVCPPHMG